MSYHSEPSFKADSLYCIDYECKDPVQMKVPLSCVKRAKDFVEECETVRDFVICASAVQCSEVHNVIDKFTEGSSNITNVTLPFFNI